MSELDPGGRLRSWGSCWSRRHFLALIVFQISFCSCLSGAYSSLCQSGASKARDSLLIRFSTYQVLNRCNIAWWDSLTLGEFLGSVANCARRFRRDTHILILHSILGSRIALGLRSFDPEGLRGVKEESREVLCRCVFSIRQLFIELHFLIIFWTCYYLDNEVLIVRICNLSCSRWWWELYLDAVDVLNRPSQEAIEYWWLLLDDPCISFNLYEYPFRAQRSKWCS